MEFDIKSIYTQPTLYNTSDFFNKPLLQQQTPLTTQIKNQPMLTSMNAPQLETPNQEGGFKGFMNSIGGYGGAGMLLGGVTGLVGLGVDLANFFENRKQAKKSMQMAEQQYQKENERYEKREAERLKNQQDIEVAAKKYIPFTSPVNRQ
ncbi:hypothetical protein [Helicobacter cetorum]|uniref:Uncharacterized protein n=1 Tax=Helicobacter cetorum (strain ATCC BAA-540 / CCUG 52418 / MIT 99-5656) TaxID=1163745 RepID=I0ESU0_HELCM|nr:hypothetical protein [Helicobacter cetorum]AFI05215.1 hypothetical protein HCD_00915 [Helicobacter cetorum MIT 99-5656]AFI06009.1 hypothetical protein HCD_05035 [Helicobacter cetorum MIT 99-5656]